MNINDKKQNIINTIQNTNDELLIDELYQLLQVEDEIKEVTLESMPPELHLKLLRAVEDYKQGRYITHEQMKHKIDEWLLK